MLTQCNSYQANWSNTITDQTEIVKNEDGQTVFEFLLLFLAIISISFTLMVGMNKAIAARWKATVNIIVQPTDSVLELN